MTFMSRLMDRRASETPVVKSLSEIRDFLVFLREVFFLAMGRRFTEGYLNVSGDLE